MHRTLLKNMLILSEKEIRQCLTMKDCLEVNREALVALARGTAQVPTRLGIPYNYHHNDTQQHQDHTHEEEQDTSIQRYDHSHDHNHSHHHHHHHHVHHDQGGRANDEAEDWTLFKPAAYRNDILGIKVVSVRSHNPSQHLPLVPATIMSLNAATGQVDAVLAATYLTAARTAAGSGLATAHALQQKPMNHLVIFGAGLQAELHVQAIATALQLDKIPKVTIVNRTVKRAQQLLEKIATLCQDIEIVELSDALGLADCLSTARVIVTATNTTTPLFASSTLIPRGCHINGIGSYTPDMQEVPSRLVSDRCQIWIDTPEARSVGDLQALTPQHPVKLLGEVLQHQQQDHSTSPSTPATTSAGDWSHLDCTFYKAVGTAIQDVMTADLVVRRAREGNLGSEVDMS